MSRAERKWQPEEIEKLKEHLENPSQSVRQLAFDLNRSYDSVECKIRRMNKTQTPTVAIQKPKKDVLYGNKPPIPLPEKSHAGERFGSLLKRTVRRTFSINQGMIKTLWLFDSHFPHNIPMKPLLDFIRDYKPDVLGFGGDNWSMDLLSRHDSDGLEYAGFRPTFDAFNAEVIQFRKHIMDFVEASNGAKIVYLLGNHEDWLEQFIHKFPQITEPTIESLLNIPQIQFVPRGGFYSIGLLSFCHGDQFGTQNPPKQAVERCRKGSVVFGHHHSYKIWPAFGMIDAEEKHLGIQVPCYCKMAPKYMKGRPHAWQNGFFTASVLKKSGKFSPFVQLVSPKGSFITQAGKWYK